MLKNAISFWLHYKKQMMLMVSIISFATLILLNVLLFLRGNSMTLYESALDSQGNYNYCFLNMTGEQLYQLEQSGYFEQTEVLYKEGRVGISDEKLFIAASAEEQGLKMFHYRLREGSYPKAENEVALFQDTCKNLGVAPVVGEKFKAFLYDDNGKKREKSYKITGILRGNGRLWYSDSDENPYPEIFVGSSGTDEILLGLAREKENVNVDMLCSWLDRNGFSYERTEGRIFLDANVLDVNRVSNREVHEAMESYHINDFETVILIPLFSLIIMTLSLISLFYSLITVLKHRRESLSLYCLMGMTQAAAKRSIIAELAVLSLFSMIIGLLLGTGLYVMLVHVLSRCFHIDIISAFEANEIICLKTLPPYWMTIAFVLGGIILSMVWVMADWKGITPMEAVRRLPAASGKQRRKKRSSLYSRVFGVGLKSHLAGFLVIFLLFTTIYGVALLMLYKNSTGIAEYELELEEANIGGFDYMAKRDFSIGVFGSGFINRRDAGFTKEDLEQLKKESEGGSIKASIEVPSIKVLEPDSKYHQILGLSMEEYTHENQPGMEDMCHQEAFLQGYSLAEFKNMYSIPVVGVGEDALNPKTLGGEVLDGGIHKDALQSGAEVLLIVKDKAADTKYRVGDSVQFTDVLLDPEEEAYDYNFSEGGIPGGGMKYSCDITDPESGKVLYTKYNLHAFGRRKDFTAKIGGILYLNDTSGEANFYQCRSLMTGENQIEFITGVSSLAAWGLPDCAYNNIGVGLKDAERNQGFAKAWYRAYGHSMDMDIQSVAEIKAAIWEEKLKYSIIFVVFSAFLMVLGLLSVYQCIQLQMLEKKEQIGIFRLLGMGKWQAARLYFFRYAKYIIGAAAVAWLPLFLNWLHKQYIINISLRLAEQYNGEQHISDGGAQWEWIDYNYTPEHIKEYCDVITEVDYHNWFYYLDGGIYNFDDIPVWVIYAIVILLFGLIVLFFVFRHTRRFITDNILEDMRTEE